MKKSILLIALAMATGFVAPSTSSAWTESEFATTVGALILTFTVAPLASGFAQGMRQNQENELAASPAAINAAAKALQEELNPVEYQRFISAVANNESPQSLQWMNFKGTASKAALAEYNSMYQGQK